jgi:hypothetical protein
MHILHKLDGNLDMSWECIKEVKYSGGKTADDNDEHRCLVEWINFFELCLSNPPPIISFDRDYKLLDKSPFCHDILYCKAKQSLNKSQIFNVSNSPTKYKFGI